MATLVLGTIGSALGGTLGGPVGAVLGKAVGSFLGNALDQRLFGQATHREGPRLANLDVQASTEGAGVPIAFGRVRLTGQVIWSTRFEEVATTTRHSTGGKGGGGGGSAQPTTSTSYSYFGNLAIGLCEGTIASVSRVWADGKLLDLNTVTMRIYRGTEDQSPDPLITSKEGASPAFRGTAYVVFERLPLDSFGNRLPQLSFEIIRPVAGLEEEVRAITIIPGATEFGYDPGPIVRYEGAGVTAPENTHDATAQSDWSASMDQLQSLCPNLERVALVVSWFGTSLDAAQCQIEPRVERDDKVTSTPWQVAGLTRSTANLVSEYDGKPAYGGSPSDASVIAAIKDLKQRGLKVTLLPFIMMDIPSGNTLTDPWTGMAGQPAYAWRGRITVSPAPGQSGSPDATSAATADIAALTGTAEPSQFSLSGETVTFSSGPEWSLRRFLLHMAMLAQAAGGVDAFLLSSELRGLTTVRNAPGSYPFVDQLVALAADVRQVLGSSTILTYGADWSEYSNHQPDDGSGDLTFHLDPLWASPDIDVIGIDQYQPITDWRHESGHADAALGSSPHDPAVILAGLTGGENHDWYYASDADRAAQNRTPIHDGAYGEHWVYRSKDMASWWTNPHHNRVAGVCEASPTAFVPGEKSIWLAEFGAPAVDLAGNTPSAFPSDKPDNDSLPYGSKGYRDDGVQRAILETALKHWAQAGTPSNPIMNGKAMIDPSGVHLWTWDARPFPAFPYANEVWSDGINWVRGHWLNGRLGSSSLGALMRALNDHFDLPTMDVSALSGSVDGYMLKDPTAARGVFEDLGNVFALDIAPKSRGSRASMRTGRAALSINAETLVETTDVPLISLARADLESLPRQITLGFASTLHDYRPGVMRSSRRIESTGRDDFRSLPLSMNPIRAGQIAERLMQEQLIGAQTVTVNLPPSQRALEPGDLFDLVIDDAGNTVHLCLDRIVDGAERQAEAHCVDPALYEAAPTKDALSPVATRAVFGPPDLVVLDLPSEDGGQGTKHNVKIAAFADPWPGSINIFAGSEASGFGYVQSLATPSVTGTLVEPLDAGPTAMIHRGGSMLVDVPTGAASTTSEANLLSGANLAAILSDGGVEVVQYRDAELIEPGRYQLSVLVRGLGGTEALANVQTPAGARFVLLDETVQPLTIALDALLRGVSVRGEPNRGGVASFSRAQAQVKAVPVNLRPLSPVHMRVRAAADDTINLNWVRRTRGALDDWSLSSLPLNEESEAYQITVKLDGTPVRTVEALTSSWAYGVSDQAVDGVSPADFGQLSFEIRQIGTAGRLGQPTQAALAA
ncbi:MAG: glycoside hydrolase TIM-barrel-like domain-containing protein [Hyphomicrobiales bacterium]